MMTQLERERLLRPLTGQERRQALEAIQDARRARKALFARRGGKPFDSSQAVLDELRDQRTRDLTE